VTVSGVWLFPFSVQPLTIDFAPFRSFIFGDAMAPPPTLIAGARVLTLDDADREFARADILVRDGRIAAIGPDLAPEQHLVPAERGSLRRIDATGRLAMPGLINGHFHSPGNMMAGALVDMPLELFMLFEVPPLAEIGASPRLAYVQTLLGAVEMLKGGVTAVHDDPYYNPYPTAETIDAVMRAYTDSGLRATVSINHPNRIEYEKYPFLAELLPAEVKDRMARARRFTATEIGELYSWYHSRWHGAADGRLRTAVSNSAPQRVTSDYFAALSDFSRRHDLPFNIHILETKLQRVLGEEMLGKSLIQYVRDLGFLDERMMVIHAIWIDERDIEALAEAGCTVAHNPVCNLKLGSGVMPFRRLVERGVPICLGSDERNTDDTINLWGVAKMAGLVHKIAEPDYRRWPQADEILRCLTRGGARGMRLQGETGCLAPGYRADIILLDLDTLAFTPLNDLRRQLVFCETGSSVVMTMVGGDIVVDRGRVLTVDESALKAEIRELHAEFRDGFTRTTEAARMLEPYYRAMYLKAAERDVGHNRWVGPMRP
jgi:cytosine/adenosine deaminase-related metal-dependent hydrolase